MKPDLARQKFQTNFLINSFMGPPIGPSSTATRFLSNSVTLVDFTLVYATQMKVQERKIIKFLKIISYLNKNH